jgi:hypothetical protein
VIHIDSVSGGAAICSKKAEASGGIAPVVEK